MAVNLSTRADRADSASPDMDRLSPRMQSPPSGAHDTSAGSLSADGDEATNRATPGSGNRRKNKRKMSEPRRLSDFGGKRPRVEEDDSGVETTSAGSADKSPVGEVDVPKLAGLAYPPAIMVPTYLPYPYPYMTPAMSGLHAMHMMNAGQLPPAVSSHARTRSADDETNPLPSTSTTAALTTSNLRKSNELQHQSSPFQEMNRVDGGESVCSDDGPRQYKTMTVERRVEANARERTRVHTISAAFEALRRAVPAYSYNQKLSKLAILRIACCYILSLSRLADKDYSRDQSRPSFGECVDLTTRTIQAEGRAKKRH